MKQGSFYLTEDEYFSFKSKCAIERKTITDKIREMIIEYLDIEEVAEKESEKIDIQ